MSFTDLADNPKYAANSTLSTYTFATTTLSDVVAGDLILIWWDAGASSLTVSSCTDDGSGGQTYNISDCTPLTGGTHSCGFVWCKATGSDFGTTITLTLSGTVNRRSAQLLAFHASNANPEIVINTGSANDTASPCETNVSGTLPTTDMLLCAGWGLRCPLTSDGFDQTTPSGWTEIAGTNSGGATSTNTMNVGYLVTQPATTSVQPSATFTSITGCHKWLVGFTDEPLPSTVRPRVSRPLRVWSGR